MLKMGDNLLMAVQHTLIKRISLYTHIDYNYVIPSNKHRVPIHWYSPVNIWYDLKQIATEFFSVGMHSGEVSLEHTKNPLRHLWGKQVKSAIKVTFSH